MLFEIKKIIKEGDQYSASAKAILSPMHVSIFELPSNVKEGDIVEASPIASGGGCSIFYKFESFENE